MKVFEIKKMDKSVYELVKMFNEGKLSFDNAAQRNFVWKNTVKDNRQSMLIDSIIRGLPIPPMYCNAIFDVEHPKKKTLDFIDGLQRTNTIAQFLNNEFKLIGLNTFNFDEESEDDDDSKKVENLNGAEFQNLDEEVKHRIENYMLTIYYFENLSQDEVDEIFSRLNSGKPLSAVDITRVKAKSLVAIKELAKHVLFETLYTEKSIKGRINEDIVMKTWVELYTDEPSFLTKDFRPTIEDAVFTEEQISEMELIFRRIYEVYNALKAQGTPTSDKILRHIKPKTHIISIAYAAQKSINDGVPIDKFIDWVSEFYGNEKNGASVSKTYNDNAKAGSAEPNAINKRLTAMMANYEKFFANDSEVDKNEYHQIGGTDSDDSEQRQDADGQDLNEEQEQLPQEQSEQDEDVKYNEENKIA